MRLWFDVDDLVAYFNLHRRPSGIQRLSFELYKAVWQQRHGYDIRFCKHDRQWRYLVEVDWPALEAAIEASIGQASAPAVTALQQPQRMPRAARRLAMRLFSDNLRMAMATAYYAKGSAAAGLPAALRALLSHYGLLAPARHLNAADRAEIPVVVHDGDMLVSLGSIWDGRFGALLSRLRRDRNMRFAILVYDVIPALFPDRSGDGMAAMFGRWLRDVVPQADIVMAISQATARDLQGCMWRIERSMALPLVIPIGSRPVVRGSAAPAGRPYVLFVSTIEARKNHRLLFTVWQRLLRILPEAEVPELVFAGRMGWLVDGFLQQLQDSNWLGGKIRHADAPSDQELDLLYRNCLFTVFPSLYEGWGLPVTESLSYGKAVAASRSASVPEAGGEFCVYFNPEDPDEAYDVIHGLIAHPDRVTALEARIAARFSAPRWADTAAVVLDILAPVPAAAAVDQLA